MFQIRRFQWFQSTNSSGKKWFYHVLLFPCNTWPFPTPTFWEVGHWSWAGFLESMLQWAGIGASGPEALLLQEGTSYDKLWEATRSYKMQHALSQINLKLHPTFYTPCTTMAGAAWAAGLPFCCLLLPFRGRETDECMSGQICVTVLATELARRQFLQTHQTKGEGHVRPARFVKGHSMVIAFLPADCGQLDMLLWKNLCHAMIFWFLVKERERLEETPLLKNLKIWFIKLHQDLADFG